MLNFRKLKKDFSPSILKEGKGLYDKKVVLSAKIVTLTAQSVRLSCKVLGNFDHAYECEVEIDRQDSTIIDSNCDCTYKYDCQHLAAVIFYLEEYLDKLVVDYSKEAPIETSDDIDAKEMATLRKTFKEAETKEVARRGKKEQQEMLQEYVCASEMLGRSPFFLPEQNFTEDTAELLVIFSHTKHDANSSSHPEIQLALRLPYRSKPLNIPNIKQFLDAVHYSDAIFIGSKRFNFSLSSFGKESAGLLKMLIDHTHYPPSKGEQNLRIAQIDSEAFGTILAFAHQKQEKHARASRGGDEGKLTEETLPGLYCETLEEPLQFSNTPALLRVELEYFEAPAPKILLNPTIVVGNKIITILEEAHLFECAQPGMIYDKTYYRFQPHIRRNHLGHFSSIREMTIPEPLFGTFVENALPELMRFAEVANQENIDRFVTLPYTGKLEAECTIHYLNGELEASLYFIYDNNKIPAAHSQLNPNDLNVFVSPDGIIARNLTQERRIIEELFQDFAFDSKQGIFSAKSERKIVEFMTETIPHAQERVTFHCPENLLDQFLYDDTTFTLELNETKSIDSFEVALTVDGCLNGVTVDLLWECLVSKRAFVELARMRKDRKKGKMSKILVLDLDKLNAIVQIFDELGINRLDSHKEMRPIWSLASIHPSNFKDLPIKFSMSKKLEDMQQQMLGSHEYTSKPITKDVKATLRKYQKEGIFWLERLRDMHLNGILADDMGLGKTLQAIVSLTQYKVEHPKSVSLVVCPTSLVHNWKEEVTKFNPKLKALPIDGTPTQRKKLLADIANYDLVITSYSLLQKDIDSYKKTDLGYVILDEAQHIKNRSTRNAKSVKMLSCAHRLILTGTPIENSLEELWSLFDFLMPGFLSSYDRFVEKYIRQSGQGKQSSHLETLRRKVSPFILRRMKTDVLSELPPVSEIIYHCHLSEEQKKLYRSYANSAREELAKLVKKEGFDKIQIHVLATLTRLKQICCHPAIFAKEKAEEGDSSKYDMLMELLHTLIEGKHKTIIFSQYTRMLQIMRKDLQQQGIRFEYLDGSTKNRLDIVNKFNADSDIPIFLISLKAGGSGLNLTGADTVIHYDIWWNPAVENQATDRVHRIGQTSSVSSYKLITLGTIEEKILQLQERKKGLVQKVINTDEEAITKLTWEEVLELLQT